MYGGQALVLVLAVSLISIEVIDTSFGNLDNHEQARRKLVTDIPGFISIDCGATEDYYDNNTGIFYQTDTEFIDTGTNMIMTSESIKYEDFRQQVATLRSFPQGTKNCYTLKPAQGKNNNYLIRAFFTYGNYDGKNQAPRFDLYLGVNRWETVDSAIEGYREIIHFSLTDIINICLVNIGSGIPFISALELRLLNNSIYQIESGSALKFSWRDDIGGSKTTLRYKDDVYDRIWIPVRLPDNRFPTWDLVSTQSTNDIQSSNDAYYPPKEVMRTAGQAQNSSVPLSFTWPILDTLEYYVYFHFAEIEFHPNGQLRELNISLNDEYLITEPIKLEYLKPLTIGPLSSPVKDSGFSFSIYAMKESNLPPILNAFEVYRVQMLPDSPTDPEDVDAIMDIKQEYGVTRNWQGDPCVPSSYSWDGLNCTFSNRMRIISLNLASSGLTGNIASSLSNLKVIESLDLSNNDLTGPVPEFLAQLPSLRTLNLTGNNLSGSIPQAILEKFKNGSLNLSVDGNPNLCARDSCPAKKKNKFVVPVVASVGSVLVLFLSIALFWGYCKSEKERESGKEGLLNPKNNHEFTYSEVVSMTHNFKTVIGEGGFGKVYLGKIDGNQVAVKLLSPSSKQGPREFQTEAQLLMRVHHRNMVSLIGYCDEGTHLALIYEYMANGNLRQHLSGETSANVLDWQQRLQIAIDAAQGLEYLHNGCKPPIIHRDMKTSNILLNETMVAKIADFGLSRNFKNEGDSHISTALAGTPAYIDPEYWGTGKLNMKSDVYSFGVVLLELITGQGAVVGEGPEFINIIRWVHPIFERGCIKNIVDQKLQGDFDTDSTRKAVEIAMSCVTSTAIQRPDMSNVVAELKDCLAIEMASTGTQNLLKLKECVAIEMAPKGAQRLLSSERSLSNSQNMDMNVVDLESQMASLAR